MRVGPLRRVLHSQVLVLSRHSHKICYQTMWLHRDLLECGHEVDSFYGNARKRRCMECDFWQMQGLIRTGLGVLGAFKQVKGSA